MTATIQEKGQVLTPAECRDWLEKVGEMQFTPGTFEGRGVDPNFRNNDRAFFRDEGLRDLIFQRLQLRASSLFFAYRYEPNQFYAWHRDTDVPLREGKLPPTIANYTLLFYLNDDFAGGATMFRGAQMERRIQPRAGHALAFQHSLLHCGERVIAGTKWLIRGDVAVPRG